ncbi:hypothetical protein B296_00040828 [Ensete ventricosum]|uniref:Uncharacterized protein n=1 Tax=Ensete ventricosum TaxID=4639 RepID=A0A426XJQ8_ENSVE|nr:hypothetical protein B296_00040828 [Ensete ventricosum]
MNRWTHTYLSVLFCFVSYRRGYAAAAAAVGRPAEKKTVVRKVVDSSAAASSASSSSWVPDPVTGYYRPANVRISLSFAYLLCRGDQVISTQQKQDEGHQLSLGITVFPSGISSLFLDAGPTQEEKRSSRVGGRRVTTYVYHLFEEWPQRDLGADTTSGKLVPNANPVPVEGSDSVGLKKRASSIDGGLLAPYADQSKAMVLSVGIANPGFTRCKAYIPISTALGRSIESRRPT